MQNSMNVDELIKNIDKLKNFNRSEDINYNSIIKKLDEINHCYSTSNHDNLVKIQNDIFSKFNIIKKIHYSDELILLSNVNKNIDTTKMVEKILDID